MMFSEYCPLASGAFELALFYRFYRPKGACAIRSTLLKNTQTKQIFYLGEFILYKSNTKLVENYGYKSCRYLSSCSKIQQRSLKGKEISALYQKIKTVLVNPNN